MSIPFKVMIKDDRKREPPHPCDPKPPCDICDDSNCSEPKLCKERLKNPMEGWQTRCKPGNYIAVEVCTPPPFEHPCDPPQPCIPGKPKQQRCPFPPLFLTKIKNPTPKITRCPSPEDLYSRELCENIELLKTPIPVCKDKFGRPKIITLNPFEIDDEHAAAEEALKKAQEEKERRKQTEYPEYMYQTTLCKNLDLLKTAIKSCMQSPCQKVMVFNPFELEDDAARALEEAEPPVDPCYNK